MSKSVVKIERINNFEYDFSHSNKGGLKAVAKALTFKNPSGFAKRDKIEHFDKRNLTFKIGMLYELLDNLKKNKICYEITDYVYKLPKKIEIDDRMSGNYIHQRMAVEAFFKRRFGIIVVPTRGGKTFIASEIIRIFLQTDKGNFIFLTDNTTLHKQAVDDITAYFQRYGGIDIGEIKAGKIDVSKRVTVGMIQTIQRVLKKDYADKKKQKELREYFKELKFLCVDEIHDNCSDSKLKLYKSCKRLEYQLCLSATPYRSGAYVQNLKLKAWSGDVCYSISEETLRDRHVLSDYKVFMLMINHEKIDYGSYVEDYDNLKNVMIYNSKERNEVLVRLIETFRNMGLKTLVLFQSVKHGEKISKIVGETFISGKDTANKREKVKNEFLQKQGGVLLASNIFKKGVTLPDVQILINGDEGLEDANTIQKKGRVLGATENKQRSLIIDFFDIYDLYFSEHSENRLNTYVKAIGEKNVTILDISVEDWYDSVVAFSKRWFCVQG